jgi:hypothetical protein
MPDIVISQAIQLAIAPVFLLTGIAGLLAVMANRLARVVDRTRHVEQTWPTLDENARGPAWGEMDHLGRRRRFASWAINLCTTGALLVCLVIVAIFVDDIFRADLRLLVGSLFVCAMTALIGGLTCFLREVYLATSAIRIEAARCVQQVGLG